MNSPKPPLEALKAIWQAEALGKAADSLNEWCGTDFPYGEIAQDLRRFAADAWDQGAQAQAAAYGMDKDTGPNPYREAP